LHGSEPADDTPKRLMAFVSFGQNPCLARLRGLQLANAPSQCGDVAAFQIPSALRSLIAHAMLQILNRMEVPYETVDVLSNDMLRSGMKEYAQACPGALKLLACVHWGSEI
jgi:hypothetical protein